MKKLVTVSVVFAAAAILAGCTVTAPARVIEPSVAPPVSAPVPSVAQSPSPSATVERTQEPEVELRYPETDAEFDFVDALGKYDDVMFGGVEIRSEALTLEHTTCEHLDSGRDFGEVVFLVEGAAAGNALKGGPSGVVLGVAVNSLCPQHKDDLREFLDSFDD